MTDRLIRDFYKDKTKQPLTVYAGIQIPSRKLNIIAVANFRMYDCFIQMNRDLRLSFIGIYPQSICS